MKDPARPTALPPPQIHPTAVVDSGAIIGPGTRIWHFSHIMPRAVIGSGCNLGMNVFVDNEARIGDRVKIQNNVSVYAKVTIEDDVFCGPSMTFTNVTYPRAFIERKSEFLTTLVRRGATIGANATVICGVTIGEYALVAAGAVVSKDVTAFALIAGVPSRQIGWVCACGLTLRNPSDGLYICRTCRSTYRLEHTVLKPLEIRKTQ